MQVKPADSLLQSQQPAHALGTNHKLFHPLGALLLHTAPQLVLIGLWGWMLLSYQSFLEEHSKPFFYLSFSILLIGWLVNLGCILYHFLAKKEVLSLKWVSLSLGAYILLLVTYYLHLDEYDTLGVPSWQQPVDVLYYTGSFILPAILHGITLLALWFSERSSQSRSWKKGLLALLPPLLCYLMVMGAFGLRLPIDFSSYWFVLLITSATVTSVFFLILGGIRLSQSRFIYSGMERGIRVVLTAILPVVCLLLNNGKFFGSTSSDDGMFGDFNHPLFYVLALLNGLLISLPVERLSLRRWAFLGRCLLFPFSLYFFFVMAPFMPLSIFLVVFFGLGLLLLVPIGVLGFHLKALAQDMQALRRVYEPKTLALAAGLAFMVLPLGIYLTYQHDRVVLHQALDYLDDPTATTAEVSAGSLRRTLSHVQGNKERSDRWFDHQHTPLLSPWFTWQVLDGLSLSDRKVAEIKQIFLKEPLGQEERGFSIWGRPANGSVTLDSLSGHSYYDAKAGHWVSEVELQMHNPTDRWEEYITRFELPAGSFISDYYLYLGEHKEPGLLVEKKAALWVYDQITRQRKDPGLLRYLSDGRLELRVYPFTGQQTRRTGFTLLHKKPFTLALDSLQLPLGDESLETPAPQAVQTAIGLYLPAESKAQLPQVERRGYWHFVIDCAEGSQPLRQKYGDVIKQLLHNYPALARGAKISFTGHSVSTYPLAEKELDELWQKQSFEGGFFLERAFQHMFLGHYKSSASSYPVPVVISDRYEEALISPSLEEITFALPGTQHFYRLQESGNLSTYAFSHPQEEQPQSIAPLQKQTALAWPNAEKPQLYLPLDGKDVILPLPVQDMKGSTAAATPWEEGLQLMVRWQAAQLFPTEGEWKAQVKASFAAHVLSPQTAFMVVEEAWQRDMLLRKQEQYLNGHPGIDSGTEIEEMPEPEFWLMLLLFLAWFGWQKRKEISLLKQRLQQSRN